MRPISPDKLIASSKRTFYAPLSTTKTAKVSKLWRSDLTRKRREPTGLSRGRYVGRAAPSKPTSMKREKSCKGSRGKRSYQASCSERARDPPKNYWQRTSCGSPAIKTEIKELLREEAREAAMCTPVLKCKKAQVASASTAWTAGTSTWCSKITTLVKTVCWSKLMPRIQAVTA